MTSATEPVPADQAVDVNVNVVLQWSPGEKSTSHDVYFGTDFNEVNNADTANPSVYMGNQDANYWDTYYYNSSELDANTTYYWRIDEVAGCIAKGDVWSFNTNLMLPGQASNPIPSDGATGADLTTDLNWTAGDNATSHDVYFGTTNPPPFQVNQAGTTYDTGTMDPNTTYYWRIDEKNGNGITTGIDWSFRTAVDSNLVGWWKFDEGSGTIAYDSAGDNIGQLTNGPIWISGRIGGALSFDGVNDYVSVNDNASLDISSQLTISAWILIGAGNYDYTIVSKGDNYIFDTDPVSELSFKHGSSYYYSNSGLAYGAWQHVAVTVGSGQVKFYINGSLNKTLAQSGGFTVNNDPLRIGSSNRYFSGYIDDVRIYKRALTGSEIALLYQQGL